MKKLFQFLLSLCKVKPVLLNLSERQLMFSSDLKDLSQFNVKDNEFYNDNDVWFTNDAIKLTNE